MIILDGGLGRELQAMGAPFRQPEWSALALMEGAEYVRAAHDAFLQAGADIITTNSYAIVPFHIGADVFKSRASELLRALPGQRWLAIGPGANWPGKRWAPQHYQQLVAALANEFDAVIVLGSGDDLDQPFDTATLALPALDLIGVTDLQTVAAVLAKMRAFVGNDSGIGHIATAVACPVVTVFGPGEPRLPTLGPTS